MKEKISEFKMPRFQEIPNVGLYLEQTVKYINECLAPLEVEITSSMLSNYVKKGYIARPIKKQYSGEQIAYLLFIVLAKQTLSMENIEALFELQRQTYSPEVAYNYFCNELEHMLGVIFEGKEEEAVNKEMSFAKKTLRSVTIAVSHIIYLKACFKSINDGSEIAERINKIDTN